MRSALLTACVLLLSTIVAPSAFAMLGDPGLASAKASATFVKYGHGPLPYGLYAHRKKHHGVSNGTGYHGRGTKTGGPAGGLPGRS